MTRFEIMAALGLILVLSVSIYRRTRTLLRESAQRDAATQQRERPAVRLHRDGDA